MRDRRLARGDDGADVQVEDLVDQLVGKLVEGRALHQRAGIVDEDVEAAERLRRRLHDALRLAALGQVALDQMAGAALAADFRGDGLGLRCALIVVERDSWRRPRRMPWRPRRRCRCWRR